MIRFSFGNGRWVGKFNDTFSNSAEIAEEGTSRPEIRFGREGYRLKLDQKLVAELLPYLQNFVDTGKLKPGAKPPPTRDDYDKLIVAAAKTIRDKLVGVRDSALDKALEPFED